MEEEIEYRKLVVRKNALEAVKEARAQGDLSENFEYHAAKKDKNQNESRIRYLEKMIKTAKVISTDSAEDEVGMDNTVTVYFEEDDEEETYKIVTTIRGNSLKNLISNESPLGKALLGHKVGDRCEGKVTRSESFKKEKRMKLIDLLKTDEVTISCELFPPKQGAQLENYKKIVKEMAALKPAYMSVTYGATGGTSDYTVELANEVNNNGIPAIAHLTCVSSTREKVHTVISELKERGIENILALRGDIPTNTDFPLPDQYHHAIELIREIKEAGDFCIGGACYPEGHPEAANMNEDLDHLKEKVDAGCEYLTTQMFFDNNIYYRFLYKALAKGIDVPVTAGIMPVTNAAQVKRTISLTGNLVPAKFLSIVDRFGDNPAAMKQAGIAYATEQIIDLIANGVNHIHIYSMNKPDVAAAIMNNLSQIYVREQA